MKKLLVVFMMFLFVAGFSFAQMRLELGPTALFNIPFSSDEEVLDGNGSTPPPQKASISLRDFTFGAEGRLTLFNFVQGSAVALFRPGGEDPMNPGNPHPPLIETYFDAGIVLDLALLRVGLAVGPNFIFNLSPRAGEETKAMQFGANTKIFGDLVLGDLTLSANFFMRMESLNFAEVTNALEYLEGRFGISAMLKVF